MKENNIKHYVLIVVIMSTIIVSGCGIKENMNELLGKKTVEKTDFVLLGGYIQNQKTISIDILSNRYLFEAFDSCSNISVIIPDKNPDVFFINEEDMQDVSNINKNKRKQIVDSEVKEFYEKYNLEAMANENEIDILEGINMVTRTINSSETQNTNFVINLSGISTSGTINLLKFDLDSLSEEEIKSLVNDLDSKGEILHIEEDRKNIKVCWFSLGDTCGFQTRLAPSYVLKLKTLYTEILMKAGYKHIEFKSDLGQEMENNNMLPYVSVISTQFLASDFNKDDEVDNIVEFDDNTIVELDTESIVFLPDSCELADNCADLSGLFSELNEYICKTNNTIIFLGMTATYGDVEGARELSKSRAETIALLFINEYPDFNDYVIVVGSGFDNNPLRVSDTDENGNLIESEAKKNRAVYIFSSGNELADELGIT
ncbi:MAG: hypothetical protein IJA34_10990 [Lachnospiraceae bacterium]|nr:hypothetical protein [Lachnospiraceae bacterium]